MSDLRKCAVCRDRLRPASFPTRLDNPKKPFPTCLTCAAAAYPTEEEWEQAGLLPRKPEPPTDKSRKPNPFVIVDTPTPSRKRKRVQTVRYVDESPPEPPRKRVRKPPRTHIDCRICIETKPVDDFVLGIRSRFAEIPSGCQGHLGRTSKTGSVCKECITMWLASIVSEPGGADRTRCPDEDCQMRWWSHHVLGFLQGGNQAEALSSYLDGLFDAWKHTKKMMECTACEAVGMLDVSALGFPDVECCHCEHRMCAVCKVDWHKGMTCQQYRLANNLDDDSQTGDKDTLQMLAKGGYKRCPRCATIYIKDNGCDYVQCANCHIGFADNQAEPVTATAPKESAQQWSKPGWNDTWGNLGAHGLRPETGCEADNIRNPPPTPPLPPTGQRQYDLYPDDNLYPGDAFMERVMLQEAIAIEEQRAAELERRLIDQEREDREAAAEELAAQEAAAEEAAFRQAQRRARRRALEQRINEEQGAAEGAAYHHERRPLLRRERAKGH